MLSSNRPRPSDRLRTSRRVGRKAIDLEQALLANYVLTAAVQAGNRIRTGDLNLGKVALYQLSYACMSMPACPANLPSTKPPVGIEPTTARLRIECSTSELRWRPTKWS